MKIKYPDTKKQPVTDNLHGHEVVDSYRWLEESGDSSVKAWTKEQNSATDDILRSTGLLDEYEKLISKGFHVDDVGAPLQRGDRYFWYQRLSGQDLGEVYYKDGLEGDPVLLIDLKSVREDNATSLDYWYVSRDGKLIAYGISECGDEMATLRVKDVDKNEDTQDVITRARYSSVAWLPDSTGFYYDRCPNRGEVPENEEHMHTKMYFHKLGEDPSKDKLIFGEGRPADDMLYSYQLSADARYLYFVVAKNWNTNAVYRYDAQEEATQIVIEDGSALAFPLTLGDYIYIQTDLDANKYKLLRTKVNEEKHPDLKDWELVIDEEEHLLEYVNATKDRLLVTYLIDGAKEIYSMKYDGSQKKKIPTPDNSMAWVRCSKYESDFYLTVTSMSFPRRTLRYDSLNDSYEPYWSQETPYDSESFRVDKEWATSKDGTKLPIYIVSRKDSPKDKPAPTVLWGYGCHGISESPSYVSAWMPWVDKGGRYAIAIIRGGGEYGEQWHMDGSLANKQNTFDDFIACAERLKDVGYTSKDELAIHGGSNGGLMVGAVMTQQPDICRAVICEVPVLDLYRYHKFLIAGRWVYEFGDPEKAEEFEWLRKWSPYHNVKMDVEYPSVFFVTGENDTRVHPLHAKKMAAIMQSTSSSSPVLLRVEDKSGHNGGSSVSKAIKSKAELAAYADWQLGLSNK